MTITQATPALGADRTVPAAPPGSGAYPRSNGPLVLLDLLQSYVAETAELLPRADPGLAERSYELLELTDELEIWAIHWPQGKGLELHDHGGSVGALWVVEGTLEEHYVRPERTLGRRTIVAGGGAAFGPHYVHDVVNAQAAPATSVHAYSPPMESMTFYRQEPHGLVAERAEYRSDPTWAP
ncbi:MAG: cysteine dioxygenase family protein [Acidimicrobiales bacterium]|jgi:predicted metal-dependent enzyme (double-stranded beta helix superfamily)